MAGEVQQRIEEKLKSAFSPQELAVTDESALHHGHAGAPEGGQSHFHVEIRADSLSGLSRVERQRAINKVLAEELAGPVHALRMTVR
ncbi:BolA family protein [Hyphobacterium sp. HN65]|uniref:BolA family protein n=1 Tax=Hyphobacterium lacteum TaxID=3116575 RepID=A0ABU7LQ63_9PROT|nr:BolA family protein [Hyphobacterium sp. HN65]MEE2526055.1 BolA family protein [Hyphobacterium sp. HN65]